MKNEALQAFYNMSSLGHYQTFVAAVKRDFTFADAQSNTTNVQDVRDAMVQVLNDPNPAADSFRTFCKGKGIETAEDFTWIRDYCCSQSIVNSMLTTMLGATGAQLNSTAALMNTIVKFSISRTATSSHTSSFTFS